MARTGATTEKKPRRIQRYWTDYAFMAPFLTLFAIFTIVPVVIAIAFSFCYFNGLEMPYFIGLENYFTLFLDDTIFTRAFVTTLALAVVTGPISYLLCLFLAWMINEFSPRLRAVMTLLFYAPSISGGVYMIWSIIYSGDAYGLLNGVLMSLGIIYEPIQWLTDSAVMFPAAVAVILWTSLGTSFLSFIAGFQNVDKHLYEAGAVDGIRNRWQELWYITLPAMKPQLLFGAVMTITSSFNVGDIITGLFGFPSANYTLHTMVHHLQDYGNIRFELGYSSSIATILFIIMVGANFLIQKLLSKVGN